MLPPRDWQAGVSGTGKRFPGWTPKDLSKLGPKGISAMTPRKITKAGLKSFAPPGCSRLRSLLVCSVRGRPIGLVAINTLYPCAPTRVFKSLVPRFRLGFRLTFLFLVAKGPRKKHIQSKGRGATFKEVSKKIVEGPPKSLSRRSPSRSGLRGFWMRRTPCGPSAARPSPSSTSSSSPPSSTCSATPSPIPWGGEVVSVGDEISFSDQRFGTGVGLGLTMQRRA